MKWGDSDALEQKETAVFFYYPEKPDDKKWAVSGIGHTTGVHGCAVLKPEDRWVFVTDDGEVYVVGKGDDDYEARIPVEPPAYFTNVRSIQGGHAISVGPRRKVFLRKKPGTWEQLSAGLFPDGERTDLADAGFRDIAGFSESDLYACGGRGDLWHFDGRSWTRIDCPTNAELKNICCAENGVVYITTDRKEILAGRDHDWQVIQQDATEEVLEGIVEFGGQVIISTVSELYVVDGLELLPAGLGEPPLTSRAHIASGDGILVVAGSDEAAIFDGSTWTVILEPEQ